MSPVAKPMMSNTVVVMRDIMKMCFVGFSIQIELAAVAGSVAIIIYSLPGHSAFSNDRFCCPKSKNESKNKEL